ncbi:hypothetical protein ACWDA7_38010 [Streptomyces sp. NPDC001156]
MSSKDDKRGKDLAELARLLLLWLQDNELPGTQGLRGTPPGDFELYAGTYHELQRNQKRVLDNRILPHLWDGEPDEFRRFQQLRLGVSHLLLVDNPNHVVQLPDGRRFTQNRIVEAQPGGRLDREGALVTVAPELDSRDADDETLGRVRNYDVSAVLRRVDMVWDDVAEAVQAGFRYPTLLSYDPPRLAYDMNVKDIIVPAGTDPREFRDTLYNTATYENRRRIAEDGGDHYNKWQADRPRSPKRRDFRPTLLSDKYLKDCFTEFVMKKGDDVLLVELPAGRAFYRLLRDDRRPRRKPSDALTVRQLLVIGKLDPRSAAQIAADIAQGVTDTPLVVPVRAVLFHVLEGGHDVPTVRRGKLDYSGGPPTRFTIDYRAYVRWYHGDRVDLGADENWFQSFVDTFFADAAYIIDLEHPQPDVDLTGQVKKPDLDREELFLKPLRAAAATAQGPVRTQLQQLVEWCKESPYRFVFLRGTDFGLAGKPHELIGIAPSGDVYEWLPHFGVVTRMRLADWFQDLRIRLLAEQLYRDTAGLLPFIAIVTWGGVIVMTGGVLGMGGVLGNLARQTVRELGVQFANKEITQEAARKAAPLLAAAIVEGVVSIVSMLPVSDSLEYKISLRFLHGFCDGFSSGAITHYLSEADERLKHAAELVPEVAANVWTKGGYRVYLIYRKVSVALDKLALVVQTVQVLSNVQAQRIADQLSKLSESVGTGFLVILFVVVYINFLVTSKQNDLDAWVDRQRKTLQHMIKETGDEIVNYLDGLRADIADLKAQGAPVTSDVLHKHDEKLRQVIKDKLSQGAHDVAGVADFLVLLLREMGVENWEQLRNLDLEDLLARGWAALPKATLLPEVAEKFGHALGELAGTIMLERRLTPKSVRKGSSGIYNREPHNVAKLALNGGIWRALWRFVLFPFRDLSSVSDSMRKALESQDVGKATTPGGATFSKISHGDTAYRQLLLDLLGDSEEISRRIMKLAEDEGLKDRISQLVTSVAADKLPPHFGELINGEHPEWPGDAVMFVLYTWLRIGMNHLLSAFELIHDDKPFDGKFKIADLLDVLGIDVDLKDKEALALKALTWFTSAVAKQ